MALHYGAFSYHAGVGPTRQEAGLVRSFKSRISCAKLTRTIPGVAAGLGLHRRLVCVRREPDLQRSRAASSGDGDAALPGPSSSSSDGAAAGEGGADDSEAEKLSGPFKGPRQRLLQISASYSKTEPHYLQAKARSKWWKRGSFPKIPHDDPDDAKIGEQPVKLWQKVTPLAIVFFFSSFNLTILQALKDSIMVTAAGAETLPFLGSFVVLPASIAFFTFYSRLVNNVAKSRVYFLAIAPFIAFYAAFAAFIYPMAGSLHPHGIFEQVAPLVPVGLHGLIRVVEHWTFSLFFCFAELWGSVVIAVLFWSLANDTCSVAEAKTVYPLMGIAANVALVAAGTYMKYMTSHVVAPGDTTAFLQLMVGTIVACAVAMGLAKAWIDVNILAKRDAREGITEPKKKDKKSAGTMAQNFAVLKESPKIMNLALLVVCYAVCHRVFEFAWKGQLRVIFPTAQLYSGALADVSIYTGYTTIALMLCGKFVFEKLGWGVAALATPTVMLLAGVCFFGLSMAGMFGFEASAGLLTAGAIAGAVTQVFARSSKFSLFDPAKEMVYIEMTKEEKSKGKAAVDLMGSQFGKSGASWVIQGTLIALGNVTACLPVLAAVYLITIATWMKAAVSLNGLMAATEQARQVGLVDVAGEASSSDSDSSEASANGGPLIMSVQSTPVEKPSGAGA